MFALTLLTQMEWLTHLHLSGFWQLQALGREKMVKELIQYVRIAEEQCVYRSTHLGIQIYNTFLHSLVEAKEVSISVFDAFVMYTCVIILIIDFPFSV